MIEARFEAMEGMYEEMQEASAQPDVIADVPRWRHLGTSAITSGCADASCISSYMPSMASNRASINPSSLQQLLSAGH